MTVSEHSGSPSHFSPGHFYSTIPDQDELRRYLSGLNPDCREIAGVDLHESEQVQLLEKFEKLYHEQPFSLAKSGTLRYGFENNAFRHADALTLYGVMRHFQPKKIVEVGCGYSSCALLDINELFLNSKAECLFIDPHPEEFLRLARPEDSEHYKILRKKVQDVESAVFERLEAGDILFIDSSHVVKAGNDGMDLFFRVLPRLKKGVLIHFHDVIWPFEYLKRWLDEGWAWNEAYVLRAFLQFNRAFKILFWGSFLQHFHEKRFAERMPLWLQDRGGSLWLIKTADA